MLPSDFKNPPTWVGLIIEWRSLMRNFSGICTDIIYVYSIAFMKPSVRNHGEDTMEKESWRRNHARSIMQEESWKRHDGTAIMEEQS